MTAPTTGEREPDALLLMRKQTKRLTAWRQCDDAQAIRSAEHVVCSFYAKDLAEVVSHVDAIRADLARVTAERDEDRRDYAADTAMAVACIEALREVRPEWESLFYATEESKMEDCAAFTIRQLADALATAQREAAGLREELTQYRNDLLECRDEERSARRMLQSLNYRRCDIPACNCGSWHLLTPAPEAGR